MKQILQSLKTGATEIAEVPCPAVGRGQLLIRSSRTLVSAGTERMLVDFGKASVVGKARQQPDKVRQVIDRIRTDGWAPTLDAVLNKLDQPVPLGYCNVGRVLCTGAGTSGFASGDRVVSNGKHAEAVAVPVNLCAKVPDAVSDEEAVFTVLGAIALQGIRLVQPALGEAVIVTGLGLIGLVAVQLLRAHGCRVLGLDFDPERLALAERFGAQTVNLSGGADPYAAAQAFTRGHGADAVIITAATRSSEPVRQAARMCRKRGRIVLVGVTGLELSRADFYEKELTFQVSCSYGPGRYDPNYEEKGQDYPIGFVRWTEQRNFEAVLDMIAERRLDLAPLISHRFALTEAERAYALVTGDAPSLGIVLQYPDELALPADVLTRSTVALPTDPRPKTRSAKVVLGFIGSGSYAGAVLVPAFKAAGARLACVASSAGVSGWHTGRKFGFEKTTTDADAVLGDPEINAVVIATRHDTHADLVCRALRAGKHVFVEKPLTLTLQQVADVEAARRDAIASGFTPVICVGFNRRFAPQVQKIKQMIDGQLAPKAFVMTVNAGALPANHWLQDRDVGGGRILGEACHFVDLLRFLAGKPITSQHLAPMQSGTGDTATITLGFADGSIGTIHYFANGAKAFAKERLEVFSSGRILQLDNFRRLKGFGWRGFNNLNLWRQDKGQLAAAAAFINAITHGGDPMPFAEVVETASVSVKLAEGL